jgi:ElaB/YqjD/DUF883 family membrane-anchored ribosome-binding protein
MDSSSHSGNASGGSFHSAADDDLTGKADQARQAAEQVLEDLKQRGTEFVEQGRHKAAQMATEIERQIRRRPVEAVAIAAGIGFALGFLWNRRS